MWEVQTNSICQGWHNCWGTTDEWGHDVPWRFTTEAEANSEMAEALRDDPDLELRVVKVHLYRFDVNISQHWDQEYWAVDAVEATKMAEEEAGNPAKHGWRWNDGQYEIFDVTLIPDEELDLSCEEPEAPHTATV